MERAVSASLRILVVADVSPAAIVGGAERVVWAHAAGLAARGHDVRIVCRAPSATAATVVPREGVIIEHFAVDRRSPARFITSSIRAARTAVGRHLAAGGVDVLHVHQPVAGFGAALAAGRRVPMVYTFHSPAPLEYELRRGRDGLHRTGLAGGLATGALRLLERACLARASQIHVLSDYSAGLVEALYHLGDDRVVRIPGGVDASRFRPAADRAVLRKDLGLAPDRRVLVTVRNLQPRMGLDALLVALDAVRAAVPDVLLLVGGDGPLRAELEALVAARGLGEHVRFLGFVDEAALPHYLAAADAFVLPTRDLEGFGLVTVEALACGTPVLGTPVGATPEILRPLDPGLVFADATPAAIADGVQRFFAAAQADADATEALRRACRRHVEAHYTWDGVVGRLEDVLRRASRRWGASPRCPVCGAADMRPDFIYRRRPYWRCPRCEAGMMVRVPTVARLRHLYEVEYPEVIGHEHVTPARRAMFADVVARLPASGATRRRLLDVGCSGGHFLELAAAHGWRGVGTDLSFDAVERSRRTAGVPVVQADSLALPVRDGAFDAVTLLSVIDHTSDPMRAVTEAARVLAPGGHLLFRVPNASVHRRLARITARSSLLARRIEPPPVLHVFTLTPRSATILLERAGLRIVDRRNSVLAADASGVAHWLGRSYGALARALEVVSAHRILLAPSVEFHARKPPPIVGDRS